MRPKSIEHSIIFFVLGMLTGIAVAMAGCSAYPTHTPNTHHVSTR